MERPRRQGASQDRRQPRKKRRPSPLPGAPSDRAGSRAGVSRPCRRRLFGSAGPPGPQPGSLKGRSRVKSLPKIKENHEVSQVSHSCNQSNQVNVQETTDLEKKEEKMEESTVSVKESLMINFESKGSLKNPEVTSSTGMTLPTGVSTFLLQCLDEDSTADYNAGSGDNLNSCLSPEIFRNNISEKSNFDAVDPGKYKNSTLLDSSKAVTIDKMPQISSLSPISEPVLEDFQDQYATSLAVGLLKPNGQSVRKNKKNVICLKKVSLMLQETRQPNQRGRWQKYHQPNREIRRCLCVADEKSAALSELHHAGGLPALTKSQLTQRHSALLKECPKMLLQVRKIGSAVNTNEIYGFQQEISTEEITVLILWQESETAILTSN
ncbi:meiosis-specific kinetochore protein isoform X3 [Patagioenas fasciata]|uniref:meiosis-specific kinetochore protein isoform X3 n=1 Tax=Patagioenas fasciata TaxID=372321 RepID=UPI003A9A63B8